MKEFKFAERAKVIERTNFIEGKVLSTEDYVTKTGVPGIIFNVQGVPYGLRVLKGSLIGGTKGSHFVGCVVKFTGVTEQWENKDYFRPKDAEIVKESALAQLAKAGVAYAGSLD